MKDTATRILDAALDLIQTRGFSAISYADIATRLNIRKASIHYHFPRKSDLGVAVVKRYADAMTTAMQQAQDAGFDHWQMLEASFAPYREFNQTADRVCLCGALAGEFLALPEPVQEEVSAFFKTHHQWLEQLLENGRDANAFHFSGPAATEAGLVFSALQGALLVRRTIGNAQHVEDVIKKLSARLKLSS